MLSLDVETTGLDLYHGARPFFCTLCREDGSQLWWEWDVDPLTRRVSVPTEDVATIQAEVDAADRIVGHNFKFDLGMLGAIGVRIPWEKVDDTCILGHVLASNHRHDLTSMTLEYLNEDIEPLEKRLGVEVQACRRWCRSRLPAWRIAREGLPEMPSCKGTKKTKAGTDSAWRNDMWLPRALYSKHPEPKKEWLTALADYSNADSNATLALWMYLRDLMARRGLTKLYEAKMASIPSLIELERRGTTYSQARLKAMASEYDAEKAEAERVCLDIAARRNHPELVLPKAGVNKALTVFCFGNDDGLDLPIIKRTDGGAPSLDKEVIEAYKGLLARGSEEREFIVRLSASRRRAKSNEFLRTYEIFGVPGEGEIAVLHPSVNPTATDTTRFSMSNPNLQQVSKQESLCEHCHGDGCDECGGTGEDLHSVRQVFGPAPGREWWSCDAKNIELRIPAYESGEADLIALFERPDDPPFYGSQHMLNMSIVFDDVWREELRAVGIEKVGPHCKKKYAASQYHWAKCGGLAMQYQCGEATADRTFRRKGGYAKIKGHFRGLAALNEKYVRHAERFGWVETLPDRSVCPERGYPLLCARGDYGRVLSTVPLNYHVQGSAGWWMVRALTLCHAKLQEWHNTGFDGFIALTVHDEIVFDLPAKPPVNGGKPQNLWRVRILQRLMEQGGIDIGIPTPVSAEYHANNWHEGVTY